MSDIPSTPLHRPSLVQPSDVPGWELIVQNSPNHLWRATPAGELDFVNARMADYFGRGPDELIAGGWTAAVHPADLPAAVRAWREALASGSPYEAEYRLQSAADNLYYWHRSRARPVRDAQGDITCWVGTNVEINSLRRTVEVADARQEVAQLERDRLMRLFRYAPAQVLLYAGPEFRIVLANPVVEAFFGKKIQIGRPVGEQFPELEGQGLLAVLAEVYRTGEPFRASAMRVLLDRDGDGELDESYWDFVLQPLSEPGEPVTEILSHAVEVTDLVRAREEAERLRERLDRIDRIDRIGQAGTATAAAAGQG